MTSYEHNKMTRSNILELMPWTLEGSESLLSLPFETPNSSEKIKREENAAFSFFHFYHFFSFFSYNFHKMIDHVKRFLDNFYQHI